jgi:protection-of-telomeres protein 1
VLRDLREKLFLLWGEVEEKKQANELDTNKPPSNKPFDCCIQEYGISDSYGGWTRMHRMFHTVIK